MSDGDSKVSPGEYLDQLQGAESVVCADTDGSDLIDDLDLDFSHLGDLPGDPADEPTDDDDISLVAEIEAAETPADNDASKPAPSLTPTPDAVKGNAQLTDLFDRVHNLLGPSQASANQAFRPNEPTSLEETLLTYEEVERLILKFLLSKGSAYGRAICTQIRLPYNIVDPILKQLKLDQMVSLNGAGAMGDYNFAITDFGRERARRYNEECTYFGAAPVALKDYLTAMSAQSVAKQHVTEANLREAFSDLIINEQMLDRLGPAINSGRGMFLFGEPGNGKTSIAERITKAFGSSIWIPRALGIDGDIIRLFDPGVHEEIHEDGGEGLFDLSGVDQRWVQIVRPTVIAGGELTMSELEVVQNLQTKICEAPLQLKSNCGTLVIDDFGRQTMPVDVLLNRWIVPLEKRYDFLNLPSGKKIQVPFDQLIIFSTNLEPRDLVDGAFLRRIPYKIEVGDPSEAEFRQLIDLMAPMNGFECDAEAIDYLIETHYRAANRPFRACQPRDLLAQVKNYCVYKEIPKKMSPKAFDFAVENYFSVM
jgi:hypothetical protein